MRISNSLIWFATIVLSASYAMIVSATPNGYPTSSSFNSLVTQRRELELTGRTLRMNPKAPMDNLDNLDTNISLETAHAIYASIRSMLPEAGIQKVWDHVLPKVQGNKKSVQRSNKGMYHYIKFLRDNGYKMSFGAHVAKDVQTQTIQT
ncbi:hypothetical protein BC835DRAFT_1383012 [Cytidiella melzeri]|nr:hypothetical protein BC835DRAFT_1383012 [Cytidiella melzeri]